MGRLLNRVVSLLAALVAASAATMGAHPPAEGPLPDHLPRAESLTGRLLVATPSMNDPRFSRTVIFIVQHDSTGAMGLVVNRFLGLQPLEAFLENSGAEGTGANGELRIHYGGPVMPNLGFVLHSPDYFGPGTLVVNRCASMSRDSDILHAISAGSGPQRLLVALGYAGWGSGQLKREISETAWVVVPADEAIIFDDAVETKWRRAMAASETDHCGLREATNE